MNKAPPNTYSGCLGAVRCPTAPAIKAMQSRRCNQGDAIKAMQVPQRPAHLLHVLVLLLLLLRWVVMEKAFSQKCPV